MQTSNMVNIVGPTEGEYAAAIPKWCTYQTLEEHMNYLLLCWSLVHIVKDGKSCPRENCINCDLYKP